MSADAVIEKAVPFDPELPLLDVALNRQTARKHFRRRLPRLSGDGMLRLKKIRLVRHKPGRRCVVEYDVQVERPNAPKESVTLIGKTRVRRSGNEAFRLQQAIWNAGFDSASTDGISVPEPIGVIGALQMWFQRKVEGPTIEKFLTTNRGVRLARRVAQAIHKLHSAGVPTGRSHTMGDELKILRECFEQVAALHPQWSQRLERLMVACEKLSGKTPAGGKCGIHRDFYASQVIVNDERLWLLDFDLYCQGAPSLDAGNFIAHITEQALRELGSPDALLEVERALEEEFVRLSGEGTRPAVHLYRDLTLARHILLSTRFPERNHLTERLLLLCESRFGLRV
jgi:tRNA A-37 threonylcarbamoyl transferase component Bud32